MKIAVTYTTESVSASRVVHSQGCNSISFQNAGDETAVLLGDIVLLANQAHHFNNEDADAVIHQNFPIIFDSGGRIKKIVVVKTFKQKI